MKDVQSQRDERNLPIDKVGIKNLRYPITVLDREQGRQQTVADISMYVDLPHDAKGTHMSRFVEMLHLFRQEVSLRSFSTILQEMRTLLEAERAHIDVTFPYFVEKKAPVSAEPGLMDYTCTISGSISPEGRTDLLSTVRVPVMSVCPCSLEISEIGAHTQRGMVTVSVRFRKFFWIEALIQRIEKCASSDVFSVLKRVDEKAVTEQAFRNPKFVEDIVRDVALSLKEDGNITWFSVSAENYESIHNHSAFAQISSESLDGM
ncbi:GTP cyclohydrolase FolE2 [Desulfobotulus mexicanus]|uniref:GTP cyclohydrolase FolE2 n=1 Tax=Desulfobotulus mexicanus TaxID=2586642 RepID=A0A5S5MFD4_9BACT|nr:GTP cyclohydrolase FolE2 [Desulfobotulus mexicanus]TYT74446.1 GTP cyclohydrolase I FolE2 [Desulfobotulus mexicanus]